MLEIQLPESMDRGASQFGICSSDGHWRRNAAIAVPDRIAADHGLIEGMQETNMPGGMTGQVDYDHSGHRLAAL